MRKNNFDKIPKDWEVKSLSDVTDIKVGKDLMQDSFSEIKTSEHKYPVYSNSHVNYGLYGYYNFKEYTGNSVTVVGRGDVGKAFKRSGSFGAIGRLIVLFPNEKLDNNYLSECINFHVSFHKESSAVPQLTGKQIGTYSIPIPPLPEQQKIAEILSTVDAKIEVIDQQISETQALKKGLMQRLLTKGIGHTEFKDSPLGEIPKSWEVVELVNHIKLLSGFAFKSDGFNDEGRGVKLLRGINITVGKLRWNEKLDRWWDLPFEEIEKYSAQVGDLVISMDGSLVGRNYARVKDEDLPLLIVKRVACLRAKSTLDLEFLNQIIGGSLWLNYVDAVKTSSGIPHISAKNIREFKIPFPTLKEQKQISEILATISDKLEVLSEKKSHYQELKQGLMQQLLTGKIRVSLNEKTLS